jgi:endosialidase-like protein
LNNTAGGINTAVGSGALRSNTDGNSNTAVGSQALFSNTVSSANVAVGDGALFQNTTGGSNTVTGSQALFDNTTGSYNTANGFQALVFNTSGSQNTATGWSALAHNTIGDFNTANGFDALRNNTTGFQNVATGYQALLDNSVGFKNTANGFQALIHNTGRGNTALGYLAGSNLTIGDDNICIGSDGVAGDAGVIRIGRSFIGATYIAGISGQTASGGAQVFVASDGKLGTSTSSARFKDDIKPMGKDSEAILALTPVSFRYKKDIDPRRFPQFGLIAEDVEKVNRDLVIHDREGKPNTVRYEQINAMLLNEFLKQHRTVEAQQKKMDQQEKRLIELQSTLAQQEKTFQSKLAQQQEQIELLTSGVRNIRDQLQLSEAETRTVARK